jgi:hypothetical protein
MGFASFQLHTLVIQQCASMSKGQSCNGPAVSWASPAEVFLTAGEVVRYVDTGQSFYCPLMVQCGRRQRLLPCSTV